MNIYRPFKNTELNLIKHEKQYTIFDFLTDSLNDYYSFHFVDFNIEEMREINIRLTLSEQEISFSYGT